MSQKTKKELRNKFIKERLGFRVKAEGEYWVNNRDRIIKELGQNQNASTNL